MIKWLYNEDFPGTLYTKINNLEEYLDAINLLKDTIHIKGTYYNEVLEVELYPYKGDLNLWKKEFLNDSCSNEEEVNLNNIRKKPNETEYPLMLVYKDNYNDLFWISLN